MKKIKCLFAAVAFMSCLSGSVNGQNIETVVVTGTPYQFNFDIYTTPINLNLPHWNFAPPPDYAASRHACMGKAANVGEQCRTSYNQLHNICVNVNGAAGLMGGRMVMRFFEKLELSLSREAYLATVGGLGMTGYKVEDSIIPCDTLTNKAMEFCKVGVEKMKSQCPAY